MESNCMHIQQKGCSMQPAKRREDELDPLRKTLIGRRIFWWYTQSSQKNFMFINVSWNWSIVEDSLLQYVHENGISATHFNHRRILQNMRDPLKIRYNFSPTMIFNGHFLSQCRSLLENSYSTTRSV